MLPEAFLLGLSTGTYCAMTCAPVALPLVLSEESTFRSNSIRVLLFMLGRLLAYVAVGVALGAMGAYALSYLDPETAHRFSRISWTLGGAVLTLAGVIYNFPRLKFCVAASKLWKPERGAFLLGAFTGLSMCPPFFAAAARVFGGTDALGGALYFFMFYLGTSVWFLPLFGVSLFGKGLPALRNVARATMLLLGVYFMVVVGMLGLS